MRFIPPLLLILVACSPSPDASSGASAPADEPPATGCVEVFQEAIVGEMETAEPFAASLSEAGDSLDATILNCETVDEWAREAERVGVELDVEPQGFLRGRCNANEELSAAPICEEVS